MLTRASIILGLFKNNPIIDDEDFHDRLEYHEEGQGLYRYDNM